ncbi:hypothetical protein MRB53_027899 [Persea americana]|uniref:Uncharacterized protein n=1 Tax=Persea americana TaxID=3435 RepID=A0ACC2KE14_PERAE|nr:hypothetical protein MRB53_027899 [Persea americana]
MKSNKIPLQCSKKTPAKNPAFSAPETSIIAQEMSNRSFDLNKVPDFSPAMEIGPGSRRSGVDVQVSVDLLLRAKDQLMKSADVDPPSKKILDDLINSVIEPLDLGAAVEKNRFLRYKIISEISLSDFSPAREIGTGSQDPRVKIVSEISLSDFSPAREIGTGSQDPREKIVSEISLSDFSPAREIGTGSQDPREKLVETAAASTDAEVIQAARTVLDIKATSTQEEIFPTPEEEEVADILLLLKSGKHSWSKEEVSLLMEKGVCEEGVKKAEDAITDGVEVGGD